MGYATINSPGNDPYVITVGAMNTNEIPGAATTRSTSYSSKGPTLLDHVVKPDLVAPGNNVVSLLASPNCTHRDRASRDADREGDVREIRPRACPADYYKLSGTSMATPVVSGRRL